MNFESKRVFLSEVPEPESLIQCLELSTDQKLLLIYDKCLERYFPESISAFSLKYGVEGGETLKSLNVFPEHVENLLQLLQNVSPKKLTVVGMGGGTVGDFSGFFASCFKRGVDLVHLPTTWLSAIDSAHGGKTALNVGGIKNQIGSFYPARAIILAESVFKTLSSEAMTSGMGELLKIGFINSPKILDELHLNSTRNLDFSKFWQLLPLAIEGKMKIVVEDPFEQGEIRQKLNLGHTLGHAIEAKFQVDHGLAVLQGLVFSLNWSLEKGIIKSAYFQRCRDLLQKFMDPRHFELPTPYRFNEQELAALLGQDKKRSQLDKVNFVFIEDKSGTRVESVTIEEIVQEARRQGYL